MAIAIEQATKVIDQAGDAINDMYENIYLAPNVTMAAVAVQSLVFGSKFSLFKRLNDFFEWLFSFFTSEKTKKEKLLEEALARQNELIKILQQKQYFNEEKIRELERINAQLMEVIRQLEKELGRN